MVVRTRFVIGLLLAILVLLAGAAMLISRNGGSERMIGRAGSKVAAAALRDCLGSRLGLIWHGDNRHSYAAGFGLRVVVSDSGRSREVGLFTTDARPLTASESGALEACLAGK